MIELQNLTKSYKTPAGRHYLFRDLNVVLPSGKSVGLLGKNGAGKSTLLRIIGGIDRPELLEILFVKRKIFHAMDTPRNLGTGYGVRLKTR